ncbi:D-aspartate oxidase isoform X1 [Canis lupus familiaris]|nr:D-aspartate oxidase isoform X1 [Canis lupus familiaris]XP_038540421.1 D-aspartate oxidase isoform X1 [Canis lupus familiaris]XP_038542271.1 D-aspartate oxidase isoform X1 [Canis lupus familiaris]
MHQPRVAVVGAGVVGLSTALCLSRLGPPCAVTVVADKVTPHTTSDVAAGMLIPHTYPDIPIPKQKQWFRETFDHLFAIANSAEAEDAGVHLVSGWQIFRSVPTEEVPFWADVVLGFRRMTEAELKKFPQHVFGYAFTTLKCESSTYLSWLEKRLRASGVPILSRRLGDLWELHPAFDVVVNCSGLGSRQLAGDAEVLPVRGQVLRVRAPWVKHFIREGAGLTYVYPGASDVVLGGTRQEGDWNLSPDAEASRDIFSRCCALEPSLRGAAGLREQVGLRPGGRGVRLQAERVRGAAGTLRVVHHYGHGGGGVAVHWGAALEAALLNLGGKRCGVEGGSVWDIHTYRGSAGVGSACRQRCGVRSVDTSKVHFAEGGSRLFLLGLKEEEMLVCRDAKEEDKIKIILRVHRLLRVSRKRHFRHLAILQQCSEAIPSAFCEAAAKARGFILKQLCCTIT